MEFIAGVASPNSTAGGRLFACRHCYRLGYAVQRIGPMDQATTTTLLVSTASSALTMMGQKMPPPPKPKWMRLKTYSAYRPADRRRPERPDVAFTSRRSAHPRPG